MWALGVVFVNKWMQLCLERTPQKLELPNKKAEIAVNWRID